MSKNFLYNNEDYFNKVSKQISLLNNEIDKIDEISRNIFLINENNN